jgi:antitoxin ParD1/3/4
MTMTSLTITISEAMEAWVKAQIEAGRYGSDSEYFRDLILRDQKRLEAEAQLRKALEQAEAGGVSDRTFDDIWDTAEQKHLARRSSRRA